MPRFSKKFFGKWAIFFLILSLLVSCGKNYSLKKTKKVSPNKKLSQIYVASLKEEPPLFDPVNTPPEKANLLSQQLEGLVKYDYRTMKALPALAVSWESDSKYQEWTFQLRKDVHFSNGEPLKALIVKKCWERACWEGEENQPVKEVFSNIRGYDEIAAGKTAELSGVRVIDDFTLKVSLKSPDSAFPQKLGVPVAFIYSIFEWEKDSQNFGKKPVGSGPFVTLSWVKGKQIILERNDYYWGKKPALKKLIFLIHQSPEQALQAFQSGAVQEVFVYPELYSRLKFNQSLIKKLRSFPLLAVNYLMFNLTHPKKISKDERGYLFSHIKPVQVITAMEKEGVSSSDSFVPSLLLGASRGERSISKKVFSSSNDFFRNPIFSTGIVLTFPDSSEYKILANRLKGDFEALGIKTKTQLLDWPLFFEALNQKDLFMFIFSWIADYPDAEAFLTPLFYSKGEANFSFYKSSEFDGLIEKSARLSGEEREEIFKKAVKLIESEQVAKPLFHYLTRWLVNDKVRNFQANGYSWVDYSAVEVIE